MPKFLTQLGCRVSAINLETDGRFPRSPEPIAENLGELEALVLSSRRTSDLLSIPTLTASHSSPTKERR
jgi:phosphomannomutase